MHKFGECKFLDRNSVVGSNPTINYSIIDELCTDSEVVVGKGVITLAFNWDNVVVNHVDRQRGFESRSQYNVTMNQIM